MWSGRWAKAIEWFVAFVLPLVAFLLFWEGSVEWWRSAKRAIFSSPSQVFAGLGHWWGTGAILQPLLLTLAEALAGLLIALVVGTSLGILVGWYSKLDALTDPVFTLLYSVPFVVVAVILRYILGVGPAIPLILAFLACLWPTVFNVSGGMKSVPRELIRMARTFGAGEPRIFTSIAIPAMVPYLTSATRVAVGRALAGAVTGEFLGSTSGLGYRMFSAAYGFAMGDLMVFVVTLIIASLLLQQVVNIFDRLFDAWRAY
jgi:ABC-type nitrate/sulfonate/bicarbonate transport system permease component